MPITKERMADIIAALQAHAEAYTTGLELLRGHRKAIANRDYDAATALEFLEAELVALQPAHHHIATAVLETHKLRTQWARNEDSKRRMAQRRADQGIAGGTGSGLRQYHTKQQTTSSTTASRALALEAAARARAQFELDPRAASPEDWAKALGADTPAPAPAPAPLAPAPLPQLPDPEEGTKLDLGL